MAVELYEHQKLAVDTLLNGNILVGGVGSGKSRTALAYYYLKECEGKLRINGVGGYGPMVKPKDLYIITTARKRDTLEWEHECAPFLLTKDNKHGVKVVVDSWNNISKYSQVKQAFFIFDEQRVVGSGAWVSAFLKITKNNRWILLSATPGDTWIDYIPVFIANGWYKNRTEFLRRHVVYSRYSKFPKVERYLEAARLARLRDSILVKMHYQKHTISHEDVINVGFDKDAFNIALIGRWNSFTKRPIQNIAELCLILRRIVNSDPRRIYTLAELFKKHPKIIVFYNFNYEKDLLLEFGRTSGIPTAQWNGIKHEPIPSEETWMYIVQYAAGAEGWNCIETNAIVFYSRNYSYKATTQAAGRIDRINTKYSDLWYYHFSSTSVIDLAIKKAYDSKKDFNEKGLLSF